MGGEPESSPTAALQRAGDDPVVRFVAVMWAAVAGMDGAADYCSRLRAPREYADLLELTVRSEALFRSTATGGAEDLLKLIKQTRAEQQPQRFQQFLEACSALWPNLSAAAGKNLQQALLALKEVSVEELKKRGLAGAELGAELDRQRLQAITSRLD
jgi:tRNA nucleotidyltransferase (CCA-adding enzyme)